MDMKTLGVVLIAAVLVATVASEVAKRMLTRRLERSFTSGDFDACLKTVDGPVARFTIPYFNREFMRLGALEAKQDTDEAEKVLENLLSRRSAPQQRLALLARGFGFYVAQSDRDKAAHMLELVEANGDKDLLCDCKQKFAIIFDKKWDYIDEMERRLPDAGLEERSQLCYLLSVQYESKGDKKRADEYLRQSLKTFGIPEEALEELGKR